MGGSYIFVPTEKCAFHLKREYCFIESTLMAKGMIKVCNFKQTELFLETANKQFIQQVYFKPGPESKERPFL